MTIFWGVATVVFIVLELATVGLASIWFALGSLCAMIASLLEAPLWLQIIWFLVISAATLILTRPLVRKYINSKTSPTNADRLLGSTVVVRERIDNINETGAVLGDGKMWSARSVDGSVIEKDALVTVKEIQGVKLLVALKEKEE